MKRKIFLSLCAAMLSGFSFADSFKITLPNGTVVSNGGSANIYCSDPASATFTADVTYNAGFVYNITFELFLENTLIKSEQIGVNASGSYTYNYTTHVVPGNYKMRVKKGINPTVDLGTISMDQVPDYGGYTTGTTWSSQFTNADGFSQTNGTLRLIGDVNGDGKDDIIGFGTNDVSVSLCSGSSFGTKTVWHTGWSNAQSWNNSSLKRCIADVNGDGKDDIVGFGSDGVYVSLSTGTSFGTSSTKWSNGWGTNNGWNNSNGLQREVVDVNGDGKADIVGFTTGGTYVALSTGTSFGAQANWNTGWGPDNGWGLNGNQRCFADVNGDNKMDIVGFNYTGVYVAKSTGTSFATSSLWSTGFNNTSGWNNPDLTRTLADVNGDGLDDIIGFGVDGVYVSKSNGSANTFASAQIYCTGYDILYGYNSAYPRMVGYFNADGLVDIAGFGSSVVTVSLSTGSYSCSPWYKSMEGINRNNYANFGEDTEMSNGNFSISEVSLDEIDFYPNPSDKKIAFNGMDAKASYHIQILDMRGVELMNKEISSMDNSICIETLTSGNYFITISNGNQKVTKKLAKL